MVFSSVLLAPQVRLIDDRVEIPGPAGRGKLLAFGLQALICGRILASEDAEKLGRLNLPPAPGFIPRPEVIGCPLKDLVEQDQGIQWLLFR